MRYNYSFHPPDYSWIFRYFNQRPQEEREQFLSEVYENILDAHSPEEVALKVLGANSLQEAAQKLLDADTAQEAALN